MELHHKLCKKNIKLLGFCLKKIIRIFLLYANDDCTISGFLYKISILCSTEMIILRPSLTVIAFSARWKIHIPTGKKVI